MCAFTRLALVGAIILISTKACGRPRFARHGDKGANPA